MCLIDKKYLNFCAGTVKISCMIV